MSLMMHLFVVSVGGALGAVSRYGISILFAGHLFFGVSMGTLFVNVVGSFCIGGLMGAVSVGHLSDSLRLFLMVGILGSFTTFSTFSLEILTLLQQGQLNLALQTILLHNMVGISLACAGYYLMSLVLR